MGYFAARTGTDRFTKKRASKDVICFVCEEEIKKGEDRYVESHRMSLCVKCMAEFAQPGITCLNDISRNKR